MAPAEVVSIVVDEDAHSMDVAVTEEKLSQAIGRGGQNIRLASELTGWNLNIMTTEAAEKKSESEARTVIEMFMKDLDVDEEVAAILVQEGFSTVEEVAYVPASELASIEDFDEEIIKELRDRARDVLLTRAIATEEVAESGDDLFLVEGMTQELADQLAERGITSRDDLAEQAVDDLLDLVGMDQKRAGDLILAARKHWFEAAEQQG